MLEDQPFINILKLKVSVVDFENFCKLALVQKFLRINDKP